MRRWNPQVTWVIGLAAPIAILLVVAEGAQRFQAQGAHAGRGVAVKGTLPLRFERNIGQTAPGVEFVARGRGARLYLSAEDAIFSIDTIQGFPTRRSSQRATSSVTFRLRLANTIRAARPEGLEPLHGQTNYLIGKDSAGWVTNVPSFARVRYPQVYDGVDLIYYGSRGELEYDFVVAPGADPSVITLEFNDIDKLEVDQDGDLVATTGAGLLRQRRPRVYQDIGGQEREIAGRYQLCGNRRVRFQLADYDPAAAIRIDPAVSYFRYVGGSDFDFGTAIAVDASGSAYVTGATKSLDFPVTNSGKLNLTGAGVSLDAFVAKLDPSGTNVVYATYLGGSDSDVGAAIAVDAVGNAYLAGRTASGDFPVVRPVQKLLNQTGANVGLFYDAFVAKLDRSGKELVYATYFGGKGDESGLAIAVDSLGSAYVTGGTASDNLVTQAVVGLPIQQQLAGSTDAFVLRLNTGGDRVMYSTYLGGSNGDLGSGIAVDADLNAYITGATASLDFPARNCLDINRGSSDIFVTKIDAKGAQQLYSSLLGGTQAEVGGGIAIDKQGNAYVTGTTFSGDFRLWHPFQPALAGNSDAFVAKLDPSGCRLKYATYLGGSQGFNGNDEGSGIVVDPVGHSAYVVGSTTTFDFPVLNGFQQICGCGGDDVFVAEFNAAGKRVFASYLGGAEPDRGAAIALDSEGALYVTGLTVSTQFPTFAPLNALNLGMNKPFSDAFVVKISPK